MGFILKDGQQVGVELQILDAEGNAAATEGSPTWAVTDETLASVTPDADNPLKATVRTIEGPGVGSVSVLVGVDADLGEGVVSVQGVLDVEIVAGDASIVNIVAGTPEARTDVAEPTEEPAPGEPAPEEPAPDA